MERATYDRMFEQEDTHWWFRGRRDIISRLVERLGLSRDRARILEAGCGTGGNLALLSTFGEVDAFEYDAAARERASSRLGREVPFGALPHTIPFEAKRYDLIGLFDVLEHVEDDLGSLTALGQRLDAEGRLIVTVPALPWMWSQHDVRHHHFRRYTRKSLTETARRAGLVVEHVFYFNTLLLPVAIAMRAVKGLLGRDSPDDTLPSPWLNRLLHTVFSSERHLVGRLPAIIGLSVCAVLRKAPDLARPT